MTRQITITRTDDYIECTTPEGAVIATLFDGRCSIIFDPMSDLAALFCGEQEIATESYFNSVGLTPESLRAIDLA